MILLDREDVVRLGLWTHPFNIRWDPNDPVEWAEGTKADWADILAEGPFLLAVNDEHAWAGQEKDHLFNVAGRRIDPPNFRQWKDLADLYAKSMGISRQGLVLRYAAMRRHVTRNPRRWLRWERVYHWSEGSDLAWSALLPGQHPSLEIREYGGRREVRYAE